MNNFVELRKLILTDINLQQQHPPFVPSMNECSAIDLLNTIKGKPKASGIDDLLKHLLNHAQDLEWIDDLKDGIVKVGMDGWRERGRNG